MAPKTSIPEFQALLAASPRVLALCGAGLSAASGLPTFRGAGGLWRNHEPTTLATPAAFAADPALVWLFYAWRRHMALTAQPNAGHVALAELARAKGPEGFLCLTQNVDGLSTRAGHPKEGLRLLHGSILDLKCFDDCGYLDKDNLADPLCPALAVASSSSSSSSSSSPLLDTHTPLPQINPHTDLPHCPHCAQRQTERQEAPLLRPGVVWFGEALDEAMLREVDAWVDRHPIDVMLVIGTAAVVYPAAGYTRQARRQGAVVAVVNPDPASAEGLGRRDFWFQGDAAEILPVLFATALVGGGRT